MPPNPAHPTRLRLAIGLALLAGSPLASTAAADYGGCDPTTTQRVIQADPSNYRSLLPSLVAGDRLELAAGTYVDGLPLVNLTGEPGLCIVIAGPTSGPPARFTGRNCCNTVSLIDSSYIVVRGLELDGLDLLGDGVKAEGTAAFAHHITIEGLTIRGHGADQQIVGINTKCPAWDWIIRGNVIEAAGTGIYLGDSDGESEFVNGLIEHNLIVDTLGYNMQVKHQNGRATGLGIPASGTTIIRRNVFSKANNGNGGGNARPNLLVGHWPLTGPGAEDDYLIYGNFFWQNPTEALFQGEGNVIFYGNLLVNDAGPAVHIQAHHDVPRRIHLFQNTTVASGNGLRIASGHPSFEQRVVGNAVFAGTPLDGGDQLDNTTDTHANAASYLTNPTGDLTGANRLDLYPLPDTLDDSVDTTGLTTYPDATRDFNHLPRTTPFRGAYAATAPTPVGSPRWRFSLRAFPSSPTASRPAT